MDNLKIALVGTGFSLRTQLPAFRRLSGCEVTTLISRERERTEELAQRHGIPRAATSLEECLESDAADLYCVATPPNLHRQQAERILRHGKHVLCEKPMALDTRETEAMCQTAEASPGVALVDHQLRLAPPVQRLKHLLQSGYLGKPLRVDFTLRVGGLVDPQRPFNWWHRRDHGGGALGALGSHAIDLLRYVLGEIAAVQCSLTTHVRQRNVPGELRKRTVETDDEAAIWLRFENGVRAQVGVSVVAHRGGGVRLELFGTHGALQLDDEGRLRGSSRSEADSFHEPAWEVLVDSWQAHGTKISGGLFTYAFEVFAAQLVDSLRQDGTAPAGAAGFADGHQVQKVLEACLESHDAGAWRRL